MKKILFIEDNENLRLLYDEIFEQEGYKVLLASNGVEGLKILEKNTVDLVVTDLRMDKMNGMEVLSCIAGGKKKLPVIIYSAYPKYMLGTLPCKPDAYITKSSNLDELKMKINELIGPTDHRVIRNEN